MATEVVASARAATELEREAHDDDACAVAIAVAVGLGPHLSPCPRQGTTPGSAARDVRARRASSRWSERWIERWDRTRIGISIMARSGSRIMETRKTPKLLKHGGIRADEAREASSKVAERRAARGAPLGL